MYNVLKKRIETGVYELPVMLKKLRKAYYWDDITEEQMNELIDLARKNADASQTVDVMALYEEHEIRIRALEKKAAVHPEPAPEEDPEWPNFDENKGYMTGDKITENGKHYICSLPEHTSITYFGPSAYPGYWEEVM